MLRKKEDNAYDPYSVAYGNFSRHHPLRECHLELTQSSHKISPEKSETRGKFQIWIISGVTDFLVTFNRATEGLFMNDVGFVGLPGLM